MKNIFKYSGLLLLLFLTLMVFGTTILYFFHISVTKLHLIIFLLSAISIYYFIIKKKVNTKEYLITCEVELDNNDLDSIEKEKENIEKILEEFGLEYIDVTMDYRYKNSNITKYF